VQAEGQSEDELTKFYTALYHTMLAPTTFSEVGGYYLGFDNIVHQLPTKQANYYTVPHCII
jgi:putative alpha-1,2-mannosidase